MTELPKGGTPDKPTMPPPDLYRVAKAVGFKDGDTWALSDVAMRVEDMEVLVDAVRKIRESADDRGNIEVDALQAGLPDLWAALEKVEHPMAVVRRGPSMVKQLAQRCLNCLGKIRYAGEHSGLLRDGTGTRTWTCKKASQPMGGQG